LIWRLSEPEQRVRNAVFFAWNPVVLVDGVLRLHNDLLMVPFVLFALWLWQRRSAVALPVAVLGALVKLTVAPLALVFVAQLIGVRRWRALLLAGAASALAVALLYAPFWFGLPTLLPLLVQANRAQWSVGSVLLALVGPWLGDTSMPVVRVVLLVACVGLMTLVLRRLAAEPGARTSAIAGWVALLVLVGVLSTPMAFYAQYLTPAIAVAALAADRRVRALVVTLSVGAMVNSLLGVAQFAGGPHGQQLDITGTVILLSALSIGVVRFAWRRPLATQ
jgi:hypothetical protein